ncbi:SDR family oxidoreductase [Microvirga sp. 17 mud 1-3]|uniref:SDR family oxidoreductase n=1 Tax=Microvirga sp. 17 mud 1-3 TaxID=2082949 RepID=UPI000D6D3A4C|nr:SDR family oxidoreductase [Microvirga sp. 17 mud 1-3]AWM85523.1 NmrA family transcriptional regulator [Microvirga sp. 17 mud 1-3]
MRIVVVGGTGFIGSRLVTMLRKHSLDVLVASPSAGVNTITGEGLSVVLNDAQVVVDVSNSPTLQDDAALRFFDASSRHILAAAEAAGVKHYIALSVVGTDRLPESGYFRAKMAQENLIRVSHLPYTILRATPFFEYITGIVENAADGDVLRLSPAPIQPIAADDVVAALLDITLSHPQNRELEIVGPDRFRLNELAEQILTANEDPRTVIADEKALYFGAVLREDTLVPGDHPRFAPTRFEDWIRLYIAQALVPAF